MATAPSVADRLAYLDFSETDRRLLADLAPLLEKHVDTLVAAFYRNLLSFPETRKLLRDPEVKERLLVKQRTYLLSLAGPVIDADYVLQRRRIGEVHERIGLEPTWHLGAYAHHLSMLIPLICEECRSDPRRGERTIAALGKLLLLDAQIAVETYIERRERDLEYLNRELSQSGQQLARDYEDQRAELRRTAERARAAEHLASIGTLVAGLAHEIGTPMGVIQGHARLLEPAVSGNRARWRLKTIQQQISRISKILQSLLNMARPARSTTRAIVAVGPLLENTLAFLDEKFRRRGIRVVRDFQTASNVTGDPERLQQLFLNLFLNAADAMEGGGELRVTLQPTNGNEVEIGIADTGIGIPTKDLPRVFDPFFTSKEAGQGNGLGLAVAKGIATDHGGSIDVRSAEGVGTEFQIFLPMTDPDAAI